MTRRWIVALLGLVGLGLSSWGFTADDGYVDGWGPAVGTKIPRLEAMDQAGRVQSLSSLSGERGLLLFMVRSADW